MNKENKQDEKIAKPSDVPPKPGEEKPFPKDATVEEMNSDKAIEDKQTVSGD